MGKLQETTSCNQRVGRALNVRFGVGSQLQSGVIVEFNRTKIQNFSFRLVRKQDSSQAGTEGWEGEARVSDLNQIGTCTGSEEGTVHIISTQLV